MGYEFALNEGVSNRIGTVRVVIVGLTKILNSGRPSIRVVSLSILTIHQQVMEDRICSGKHSGHYFS